MTCIIYSQSNYVIITLSFSKVEPVGGAARFVNYVKLLRQENPNCLLLFSGDIFSPSVSKTKLYK